MMAVPCQREAGLIKTMNRRSFLKFIVALPVCGLVVRFAPNKKLEPEAGGDTELGENGISLKFVKQFKSNLLRIAKQERRKISYG